MGRTGTFIALDMLSQQLNRPDFNWDMKVDIFDMVIGMRNNRTNMIQTEVGYFECRRCFHKFLKKSHFPGLSLNPNVLGARGTP